MIEISPKEIKGEWTIGYALDIHTKSSTFLGYDKFGHPQYDTKRSEMGELLYRLKYKSDKSVVQIIVDTVSEFIKEKNWPLDLLIPVPPSRTVRRFQPVSILAKAISKSLGIRLCTNCIVKKRETSELKDMYDFDERMKVLKDAYAVAKHEIEGASVLLFDDLYRSGATLNAITLTLKKIGVVKEVYVLTLTKTRSIK